MVEEIEEVRQDNDSVVRWLFDCGITGEDLVGRIVADVYDEYRQWCYDSGERNPFARRTWTTRVKESVTFETFETFPTLRNQGEKVRTERKSVAKLRDCNG